jgi:hypothetical protein
MRIFKLILFCLFTLAGRAQKNIIIADSLAAHSQQTEVKLGTQWFGKTFRIRFGEYAIVSSKMGWDKANSKTNFWGTKTQNSSSRKFSFVLTNSISDSAFVNAINKVTSRELNELQLFPNFSIGSEYTEEENKNFTATIQTGSDTADIWTLVILQSKTKDGNESRSAWLSNGIRKIELRQATSNTPGNTKNLPAKGYEFVENGTAVAALQYLGAGIGGLNKMYAWIHDSLDPHMKLVLASAMTSIFQLKGDNAGG